MKKKTAVGALLFCLLVVLAFSAILAGCGKEAQKASEEDKYPERNIELSAAFAAGGTSNVLGRTLGEYAGKKWGVTATFVDRPGGGGFVGTTYVLQAKPDGYTILVEGISALLNVAVTKDAPFKWDDGAWIGRLAVSPVVFVVKADSNFNTLQELAAAIEKDPGKYKLGVNAVGGIGVFATAQLCEAEGIDMTKVPRVVFDGGAPTLTAVAGGHVDFAAQNLSEVKNLIEAGKLKALAVTTSDRVKELPNVPTTREQGYEKVNMMGWTTIMGPPNLPDNVVKKWEALLKEATSDPAFVAEMEKLGTIPSYMTSAEVKKFLADEQTWAKDVAEKLGIRQ